MNGLLAFSLSNSVTEVGALAAFAALLGIAILSLLVLMGGRRITGAGFTESPALC